jgi:predicted CxxxxCH...CXXCH cytochrome family protein
MKNALSVTGRGKTMSEPSLIISKLEIIFCVFCAENNFVNALILFIRARAYKALRAAAVIAAAVFVFGCGTANNDAPSLNTSGDHPAGWVAFNGGNHRAAFRAAPDQCPQCHGNDLFQQGSKGGVARVSCSSTSFNGIICHANAHVPRQVPHPLPFTNPVLHGPAAKQDLNFCKGCHASSSGVAGSNPRFNAKIGALINGCEDCHNVYTAHPSTPAPDSAPWRGTFTHQDAKNLASACALCHGVNLDGTGAVGPACSTCHTAASPLISLNCTSCHGNPPTGGIFPDIPGRHGAHNALNLVTGICSSCHNGAGIGTLNHFNQTVNVAISATYNAKTGGPATYAPDAGFPIPITANNGGQCTNVSCHGGIATPPWRTGTINPDADCTLCHRSKTVSDQFNSYSSGRPIVGPPAFASLHDFHLSAIGMTCTDCHDTGKLAVGHFVNLATPAFEQTPASTIRDVVNYVGGSCTPPANPGTNFSITVCHGERPWPVQ